jgi:hypothetical protein
LQPKSHSREDAFEPQIHGCLTCQDGRGVCPGDPCPRELVHRAHVTRGIPVTDYARGRDGRRYVTVGGLSLYASPAEEEMIRMSALEQAVTENLLAAEAMGMVDAGELEAACAASLANPPQPAGTGKPFKPYVAGCRYCRDGEVACGLPEACKRQAGAPGDNVHLPKHYARFKIEPISFICENGLNFFQGNVVKYVLRHDAKNGLEDIRKAKRYLEMYEKYLQGDKEWWR